MRKYTIFGALLLIGTLLSGPASTAAAPTATASYVVCEEGDEAFLRVSHMSCSKGDRVLDKAFNHLERHHSQYGFSVYEDHHPWKCKFEISGRKGYGYVLCTHGRQAARAHFHFGIHDQE